MQRINKALTGLPRRVAARHNATQQGPTTSVPEFCQAPPDQIVRTGTCLRLHVLGANQLTRLLFDQRKLQRPAVPSIDELERWPRVARHCPLVPDLSERLHYQDSVPALSGQQIFMTLGTCLISPPLDELFFFEVLEPIGQGGVSDAG